ncbi:uncharacterized protein LOC122645253 [Telopea speciosissima]|uniref:uncharacterized protein LOC122645253 n=1 Tax=Telopea speciosissima TaxID=54955 RepID=UPI001CC518DB|nr:uncharacterized protein LOC122645253 [Telopea speciosissima]
MLQYYRSLYSSEKLDENTLQAISPSVDNITNDQLCRIPDIEEVKLSLFSMQPLKSPGPDGLPPAFFQNYWDLVGTDICKFVHDFFNQGKLPSSINNTMICLIPKVDQPDSAEQFRPISLCNVAVKANIFLAHETFHYIKHKKKGKKKFVAMKLDMRKAYDRLEWQFIERVPLRFGFSDKWVSTVMSCISRVSYELLINGAPRGFITPTRGIRQGDPLSLALFVLCSQALSAVLQQAELAGFIKGIKVRNRTSPLSHLLFADDSLIFSEVSIDGIHNLKACLDLYCQASGQQINLNKSSLIFSPNIAPKFKCWFSRILKIKYGECPKIYLGLPTEFGTFKLELYREINEKATTKMEGWKCNLLSHSGREIMLKSVVMSMNNFACSRFKMPASNHKKIRQAATQFYWGGTKEKKKICWHSQYEGHGPIYVADLIDQENRKWKTDFLNEFLHPIDKEAVLKIKLGLFPQDEYQVWGGTKNGSYTVKSAYHWLCNQAERRSNQSASSSRGAQQIPDSVWKQIWSSQAMPNIHNFLWRACADGLATGVGLAHRRITIEPMCPRCGEVEESADHILVDCNFARAVWFGSSLSFTPPFNDPKLFKVIENWVQISSTNKKRGKEVARLGSYICWNLWRARNDLIFSGKKWTPEQLDQKIKEELDSSFVIARGLSLCAVSEPTSFSSILEGEAIAIRSGLLQCIADGFDDIEVETDSKILADIVNNRNSQHPPIEVVNLVQDIKYLFTALSYIYADFYAEAIWAGHENPENSGHFTSNQVPFTCANDSPIQCKFIEGSSLPALGYLNSFGQDNNKNRAHVHGEGMLSFRF